MSSCLSGVAMGQDIRDTERRLRCIYRRRQGCSCAPVNAESETEDEHDWVALGRLYRRVPCRGSEEATGQYFWEVCASSVGRVYAACIPPLVLVMFKAQLPAPRLIARRLYSTRGEHHHSANVRVIMPTRTSNAISVQLCEEFGQVPSCTPNALQDSRTQLEYVLSSWAVRSIA